MRPVDRPARYAPRPPVPVALPRPEVEAFLQHVAADTFPCVGSKLAFAQGAIRTVELGELGHGACEPRLLDALDAFAAFVDAQPPDDTTVHSLVALFSGPHAIEEMQFERALWTTLQRLHDLDHARGQPWAEEVATDPDSPRFSLSLAGHPFFVIGLHPGASRLARRFQTPALVFNSHRQFNRLRADGRYRKMQIATRERDLRLQGSLNPNLADFGTAPETRQYSGRAVEADWRCPFRVRGGASH